MCHWMRKSHFLEEKQQRLLQTGVCVPDPRLKAISTVRVMENFIWKTFHQKELLKVGITCWWQEQRSCQKHCHQSNQAVGCACCYFVSNWCGKITVCTWVSRSSCCDTCKWKWHNDTCQHARWGINNHAAVQQMLLIQEMFWLQMVPLGHQLVRIWWPEHLWLQRLTDGCEHLEMCSQNQKALLVSSQKHSRQ